MPIVMKLRIFAISCLLFTLCSCVKEKITVTGITLNTEGITLEIGESQQLSARVSPADADNQMILWKTKDSQVATVSAEGLVTAVSPGETQIRAVSDDNNNYEAVCIVKVPEVFVAVTAVSLDKTELALIKGGSDRLLAVIEPEDASNKEVLWTSSNSEVVTVSQEGELVAVNTGEAVVVVTSRNGGFTASCRITVDQPVSEISLSETSLRLEKNQQALLSYTLTPEDAIDKGVSWESSAPEVASVEMGIVTAKSVGNAVIKVKTKVGELSAECSVEVVSPVGGVNLMDHNISMIVGATRKLEATVTPADAENNSVTWKSSDSEVASVSDDGTVTANKFGTADIIVTTVEGGFSDVCKVSVDYEVQSVSVEPNMVTIATGKTVTLKPVINPSTASNKKVSWKSSDPSVATVSGEGVVTAVARGDAEIEVKTDDGGRTAVCKVSVDYEVQSVSVEPNMVTIATGKTVTLKPVINPSTASNKKVSWKSSDPSVATVSGEGVVTAVARGDAEIEVKTDDGGRTAKCKVTVESPVSGISLNKTELTLYIDDEETLTATVLPADASNPNVNWSSSNEQVATVDSEGKVRAKNAGSAQICATSEDNGKHAYCSVTVRNRVESVTVTPDTGSLFVGGELQLSAAILPEDVSDLGVDWSVEPAGVVTVSENGLVKAVGKGEATVKATARTTNVCGTVRIVVRQPVTAISVTPDKFVMFIGDAPKTLTVELTPSDASDLTYTVRNTKPEVATIEDNKVTAAGVGTTMIIFTPTLRSSTMVMKTVNVEVRAHVKTISIDAGSSAKVTAGKTLQLNAVTGPSDAYKPGVKWSSSNSSVASVSADGLVSGLKVGTAVITATAMEDGTELSSIKAICTVTVENVPIQSISISKTSLTLTEGETETLTAAISPTNAYNTDIEWKSFNEAVATVSQAGVVTAVSAGTATIRASSKAEPNTFYKECTVTVKAQEVHVESIKISPESLILTPNQKTYLSVTFTPSNVSDKFKALTWASGNTSIVTVNEFGTVVAVAPGSTTITVTASDGNKFDSIPVTVTVPVSGVSVSPSSTNLVGGKSLELTATVYPDNATNKEVEWSSSDQSLATVDANGKVTAKTGVSGTVVITATSKEDPTKKGTSNIKVIGDAVSLSSVTLNASNKLYAGQSIEVSITVNPSNASLESIVWKPSQGAPFGVAPIPDPVTGFPYEANIIGQNSSATFGNLQVTVTDVLGKTINKYLQIQVSKNNVASVTLDRTELVLKVGETYTLKPEVKGDDDSAPASVSTVSWSVSPSATSGPVSVSSSGLVTAKKAGTATITVKSSDDATKKATCVVTVISTEPGEGGNQGIEFDDWNF